MHGNYVPVLHVLYTTITWMQVFTADCELHVDSGRCITATPWWMRRTLVRKKEAALSLDLTCCRAVSSFTSFPVRQQQSTQHTMHVEQQ